MVFSMQNNETGEVDYVEERQEHIEHAGYKMDMPSKRHNSHSTTMNVDEETGEVDIVSHDCTTIEPQMFDEETGEPLVGKVKIRYVKHDHFHIPRNLLRGTRCDEFTNVLTDQPRNFVIPTARCAPSKAANDVKSRKKKFNYKHDDYMNMEGVKNEIISKHKKANYRLFLIPTLFFFNIYLATFLAMLECILHFWAHKMNNLNMNNVVYFRSPLHVLTSEFCGYCRSEAEMDIQIFDRLNSHMRKNRATATLKDVSKVIS